MGQISFLFHTGRGIRIRDYVTPSLVFSLLFHTQPFLGRILSVNNLISETFKQISTVNERRDREYSWLKLMSLHFLGFKPYLVSTSLIRYHLYRRLLLSSFLFILWWETGFEEMKLFPVRLRFLLVDLR